MSENKTREAIAYFHSLHPKDQKKIAVAAIERLIEMEEVSFRGREVEYDGTVIKPTLYWSSCGEDLRE